EGDLAVAVVVRGAAEPRDQEVREERATDAVRFLRGLVDGARGQERVPGHVRAADHERCAAAATLAARESSGGARIEDADAHLGGDLLEELAQLGIRDLFLAE